MLLDLLPTYVTIDGKEYGIDADYRTGIKFEILMQDMQLTERERLMLAINLYYEEIPQDIDVALEAILWFFRCGKEEGGSTQLTDGVAQERIYSYEHDDTYIYAAFLAQYGIDLAECGRGQKRLHWWQFRALFQALTEEHAICKIMGYRSMEIDPALPAQQAEFYRKMKRLYALPDERTEDQKQRDFVNALVANLW
jgi:hypothetical protein